MRGFSFPHVDGGAPHGRGSGAPGSAGTQSISCDHGVFASNGALGFFAGLSLFLIWTLAASIMLVRKLGADRAAAAP